MQNMMPLDPVIQKPTLQLYLSRTGKHMQKNGESVLIGRDPMCDFQLGHDLHRKTISRRHATIFYSAAEEAWFLRDESSVNGTWVNQMRVDPAYPVRLAWGDVIDFAHTEQVIFEKPAEDKPKLGGDDADQTAKDTAYLEAGIAAFSKADFKDPYALKLIFAALLKAPLYLPVELDALAILGGKDPALLKKGDVLTLQENLPFKFLTITVQDAQFVPLFTSKAQLEKGPAVASIRMYPDAYLPQLIAMGKDAVINIFDEHKLVLPQDMMLDLKKSLEQK